MCSRVMCRSCNKPTWSGCGNHIEEALAGVAKKDRCQCGSDTKNQSGGFFTKLFGGR
jgi:hypothetical protein